MVQQENWLCRKMWSVTNVKVRALPVGFLRYSSYRLGWTCVLSSGITSGPMPNFLNRQNWCYTKINWTSHHLYSDIFMHVYNVFFIIAFLFSFHWTPCSLFLSTLYTQWVPLELASVIVLQKKMFLQGWGFGISLFLYYKMLVGPIL